MNKIDFKKKYKHLYTPSDKTPSIVQVTGLHYAVLEGTGNPNTSQTFSSSVEALYALSYTISMSYKSNKFEIPGFYSFVVPPLEGVWDLADGKEFSKDNLKWTIGILQPEFVTQDILSNAKQISYNKKQNELIKNIHLKQFNEGLCCTMMHIGSFDDEPATFAAMESFAKKEGYIRTEKTHREIYLSDFRKTSPDKLKTVLRFKVEKR